MTLAYPPHTPSHHAPRERLAREEVRRGLTALLRRRVPEQEVEDVAQTVLADALASPTFPTDPEELRRWLTGIARHKIADFHRRSARQSARIASNEAPELVAAKPTSYEEREVLQNVLAETRTHRDEQTMEWMVREHGGERLADIANENNLPAPVVRQRVSRLRRALRSRYAGVFALVAIVAGLAAVSAVIYNGSANQAIAPDPSSKEANKDPKAPATSKLPPTTLMNEVEGDWVVQGVHPNRSLSATEQKFVDLQTKTASISIHQGATVALHAGNFKIDWRVTKIEKQTPTSARVYLESTEGNLKDVADVVLRRDAQGPRLEVSMAGPKYGGTVTLRRPIL
jgi:DNA-directed RNA polymerase specialized sigma24 family protein